MKKKTIPKLCDTWSNGRYSMIDSRRFFFLLWNRKLFFFRPIGWSCFETCTILMLRVFIKLFDYDYEIITFIFRVSGSELRPGHSFCFDLKRIQKWFLFTFSLLGWSFISWSVVGFISRRLFMYFWSVVHLLSDCSSFISRISCSFTSCTFIKMLE